MCGFGSNNGLLSNFVRRVSREVSYMFCFDGAGQVMGKILARCSTAKNQKKMMKHGESRRQTYVWSRKKRNRVRKSEREEHRKASG